MQTSQCPGLYEPLSKRECEILALIAENCSDREIAARLLLTTNTVKWHNRQIFQKLGVKDRRQAVKCAVMLGVLDTKTEQPVTSHNLPSQLTPFVGRIGELEELIRLLSADQPRLLTLLAPGGMGKTRLALALAEALLAHFPDGVYFAALTPLDSHDVLVPAIAEAVGCPLFADERTPMQRLCDFLRRKHVLLILDDFEHVLDSAPVVSALLQAAPAVKIIVTTRERLNLTGENVYPVDGLRYPVGEVPENAGEYGAVQLFAQAAFRANPHFSAPDADIVRVCRLVQGMPLALELAAAWAGALTAAEIAAEISRSADFLTTSMRDVPTRLRSIRAVFDSAWSRLSADEQRVFAALSVFRGGCTREAALIVTRATDASLASLVSRALLRRDVQTGRYDIHELLRQYAEQWLEQSGQAGIILLAHQAYFAAFTAEATELLKTNDLKALELLDADFDNVRLAFERAIAAGTPEALLPFSFVWHYYDIRGRWHEGVKIVGTAIDALTGTDSLALAKLLTGYVWLHIDLRQLPSWLLAPAQAGYEMLLRLGAERDLPLAAIGYSWLLGTDRPRADALRRQGYAIAVKYGDEWERSIAGIRIAFSLTDSGWSDEAGSLLREAQVSLDRAKNVWLSSHVIYALAWLAFRGLRLDESQALFERSLELSRKINNMDMISLCYGGFCSVAHESGDLLAVKRYAAEMLEVERDLGRELLIAHALVYIAIVCEELDEFDDAVRHTREALPLNLDRFCSLCILRIAGILLARRGDYEHGVDVLSYVLEQPEYARFSPRERMRTESALDSSRAALLSGRRSAIAEVTTRHTLDSMLAIVAASL